MPTVFSQINKLRPREGNSLAQEDSAMTWEWQVSSVWVQLSLQLLWERSVGTWQFWGFCQIVNHAELAVQSLESLILDAKGIQQVLVNEGVRGKAGKRLTLLESAGGGGLSSGMGISSPSFKEKSTLKMKHQLETVRLFSNQKNGIYRSRMLFLQGTWRRFVKELPAIFSNHLWHEWKTRCCPSGRWMSLLWPNGLSATCQPCC